VTIETVSMSDGTDWLMRPVAKGWIRYESLLQTEIDLEDIARMNEAIDVETENEARMAKASED
jgi:hypothetical protein